MCVLRRDPEGQPSEQFQNKRMQVPSQQGGDKCPKTLLGHLGAAHTCDLEVCAGRLGLASRHTDVLTELHRPWAAPRKARRRRGAQNGTVPLHRSR